MSNLREECGVFGIYSPTEGNVGMDTYYGLYALQHRGQESCGIVVNNDGLFTLHKDVGLVSKVFNEQNLAALGPGNISVGHVRYSTTGGNAVLNAQPIVVNHIKGHLALAHNGNLVNSSELRNELELKGSIFHMSSDTEVISYLIIKERLTAPSIEEAINRAMYRLKGAYSLVIMSPAKLIAVRDENGFRPLCYGQRKDGSYVVASETCALDAVNAVFVRDLEPGEILIFDRDGVRSITDHCKKADPAICIFEYLYFARPDSIIDGQSVHEARTRAGEFLAEDHPVDADVVIGVPDSGIDAAIGYAKRSGIPYEVGILKNKYIGRTFIAPNQHHREDLVRIKLNPMSQVIQEKRVVVIDDSIVRGTTSARIIRLLKEAGAKEIHMRISAPPFLNPCYYGTDIDSKDALIACKHTIPEIAEIIGADSLGFLSVERLGDIIHKELGKGYCDACFTSRYPTEIPSEPVKNKFESKISESEEERS